MAEIISKEKSKKKPTNRFKNISSYKVLLPICGVTIIIALSLFNLAFYSIEENKSAGIRMETNTKSFLLSQRGFWVEFLEENPSYLPGWIELAKTEVQLENIKSARQALIEAKNIDPNSDILIEAQRQLGLFGL